MSDNWIRIIPEQPDFVPEEENQQRALSFLRQLAPRSQEIRTTVGDRIGFVDCGENFESVACPSCGVVFEMAAWLRWMAEDFDGEGFTLRNRVIPCCGAQHTMKELRCKLPQGFARFQLSAMNPNIGELPEESRKKFQEILGCTIR